MLTVVHDQGLLVTALTIGDVCKTGFARTHRLITTELQRWGLLSRLRGWPSPFCGYEDAADEVMLVRRRVRTADAAPYDRKVARKRPSLR